MNDLIRENVDITPFTTFGIRTKARYFAEYSCVAQLEEIMRTAEYQQSEILHIGGGSNLLFVKDFEGMVIHSLIKGITPYRKDDSTTYVIAGAGEKWTDLVDFCVSHGLAGLENLAYIPGEVGASAIQNVGAYGVEAADLIHSVECYDRLSHKIVTFRNNDCRFDYRDSMFKHEGKGRYFVLRVSYRLKNSNLASNLHYGPLKTLKEKLGHTPSIEEVRNEIIAIRKEKLPEPSEIGSAGSFFTNPVVPRPFYREIVCRYNHEVPYYDIPGNNDYVKIPAGWLVEHSGLKGAKIGGAIVYPRQCLVIANAGNATASDITQLARHVQEEVFRNFGIFLKKEVNYIDSTIYVTMLGSGTSKGVPEVGCNCHVCRSTDSHDKRLRASIYVSTRGLNLLIDASPDFRQQALTHDIREIDAVLVTHSHYDHVGGIDDLRPFCVFGDIAMYLRKDVAEDLRKRLDYCFRPHPYPGVPTFQLHEIGNEPFIIRDVKITPVSVNHAKLPIVGFRIGDFAYITDAKTIPENEIDKLKDLKVLIVNCLRIRPHFSHFNLEEALELVKRIRPHKTFLTHISHELGLHKDINRRLPEGVELAYDGMKIKI